MFSAQTKTFTFSDSAKLKLSHVQTECKLKSLISVYKKTSCWHKLVVVHKHRFSLRETY